MVRKFICNDVDTVVRTAQGKLRGYKWGDMYYFRGVKYAEAARFMMPQPPAPWEGLREAQNYGFCSKTLQPYPVDQNMVVPHRYWHDSEDCMNLNIWTQQLDPTAKKPVMVWIHGGGFANGSSIEHVDYDGENLCRFGDVVVVTVNHRLNIIGYMDLSSFDEKYHNSGNVGNADLIAALQWVKENIAQFGGDPDNVTIFGQSGGGGKVATLMQTPAADGLYHKAIIESSGSGVGISPTARKMNGRVVALAMLRYLGKTEADYDYLAEIPYEKLAEAYNAVAYDLDEPQLWYPHENDWYLGDMRRVGMTEYAKQVPIIIGSVFGEMMRKFDPHGGELPEEAQMDALRAVYGEHADEVAAEFKKAYPDKPVYYAAFIDNRIRPGTLQYLNARVEGGAAPSYAYLLSYFFDYMGTYPTFHCAELPLVFHNIDLIEIYGSEACEKLQEQMCSAWVAFAHTGDPSNAALGAWPAYNAEKGTTVVFDEEVRYEEHFDRELMRMVTEYREVLGLGAVIRREKRDDMAATPY